MIRLLLSIGCRAIGVVAAMAVTSAASGAGAEPAFSVGSKKFTESYVLGEIAKTVLEEAGFAVTLRAGMGGSLILWQALLHGDIDAYPEYTGTLASEILRTPGSADIASLRAALAPYKVGIAGDLGFNNGYALVMGRSRAAALGIKTISDLKRHSNLRAGLTPEFLGRQDGWAPLTARYGLSFETVQAVEHGLGYAALANNEIDLKDSYATDAKIAEYDLVALKDDLGFFPKYRAVFLYRLAAPEKAIDALRSLNGTIDETRMIELNRRAEETRNYAAAARSYFTGGDRVSRVPEQSDRSFFAPIPRLTAQHLLLVSVSLLAAILVSIPLGVLAAKPGLVSELILGAAGVLQTIPSLALLALMIPLFGIGRPPAIVALFLYSLLPIIRSTAVGLQTVTGSLGQASAALGLSRLTRLIWIDLPIASPSVLAGIKTSAVINVGTATLAGLIGGGGYGEPIQSGLQLNDSFTILQGAIPAAVLALLVQAAFTGLDRVVIPAGLRLKPSRRA
jgi:osmoprotectant transport system permease protein